MQGQKCYDESAKPEGCENTREGTFKSDWENWVFCGRIKA